MTQAVSSNLGLHVPSPYGSSSSRGSFSRYLSFSHFFKPVKAMAAGDARDKLKLDHLQRPTKSHFHPKRTVSAPIGLWDRFPTAKTVQQMMETMERMMEDPFAFSTGEWPSSPMPAASEGGGVYRRGRTPWEIKEGEEEYKMRFDMPGMTKEDVKVWVEEKMLVVKAEKEPNKKDGDEEWSAKSYGRYNSRIALPENVKFEKIKAEVKDGVLYITIPKATTPSKVLDIHVQ